MTGKKEDKKPRKKHVPLPKNIDINLKFDDEVTLDFEPFNEVIDTYVNVKSKTISIKVLKDD
jgi:hypothetical protein|tara:strand:- start:3522 stop:3707 length:186 start_codon:yes stop_codon:yes gene_type:complete